MIRVEPKPLSAVDQERLDRFLVSDELKLLADLVQSEITRHQLESGVHALAQPETFARMRVLNEPSGQALLHACRWKIFLDCLNEIRDGKLPRQTLTLSVEYGRPYNQTATTGAA